MLRCESVRQKERHDWKVLVMDRLATRIISASCKMHDIMSEGITSKTKDIRRGEAKVLNSILLVVEDVMKKREPLTMLEAVYFVQPNEKVCSFSRVDSSRCVLLQSINELINDFDKAHALVPKYKAAHVFFTEGNWM